MSNAQRLRQLLQQIQERLQRLGSTNKTRWGMFQDENKMTIQIFTQRLGNFGISISPQDVATLWRATGIQGDIMQYADFIRFLQAENVNIIQSPKVDTVSLSESLRSNKLSFIMKCMENDPTTSGFISYRVFSEICSWFETDQNPAAIRKLVQPYDPTNSGSFNYFSMMADFCNTDSPLPAYDPEPIDRTPPRIDVSFSHSPERSLIGNRSDYTPPRTEYQQSPVRQYREVGGRDDLDYTPESPNSRSRRDYGSPQLQSPTGSSGGRGRLDPAIFGSPTPQSPTGSSGGRGRLDPAIFGQPPVIDTPPPQPIPTANDIAGAKHMDGLPPDEIMMLISRVVSRVSSSNKTVFSKWRGGHTFLEANDIRDGLARDGNVVLPLSSIQMVTNQYGGTLSFSAFVRLLGDGSQLAEESKGTATGRKQTEDEAAIVGIAQQLHGTEWRDPLLQSQTVEDAVRILARFGCEAEPRVIRTLQAKLGKLGLVNALNARVQ